MTITAAALLALATFLVGLYLGHRWATHDARIEFAQRERRYQKVIRFAQAYIEANAPVRGHAVIRNDAGAIVDLHAPLWQCGTSALAAKAMIEEVRQRNMPR